MALAIGCIILGYILALLSHLEFALLLSPHFCYIFMIFVIY